MKQRPNPWFWLRRSALWSVGIGVAGLALGGVSAPRHGGRTQLILVPYSDPWPAALPRLWDIDDDPYQTFIKSGYSYRRAVARLTYQRAPATAYFIGHIRTSGLKPNFAYQLKLCGKPARGSRGWGAFGDDVSNERIGYAGRWWDDTVQENTDDNSYLAFYKKAPGNGNPVHTIYGYLLMGDFVTDQSGNADLDFTGAHSYHVTWQNKQLYGNRQVPAGAWAVRSTPPYYGYGSALATKNIKLWYEQQSGRPQPVHLPSGNYNCRLLITEESFHNQYGGTNDPRGGFWLTVLATENYAGGPDTDRGNDVRFVIG